MKQVFIVFILGLVGSRVYAQNSAYCKPLMHATVAEANYSGAIVIPQTVEISGSTYIVTSIDDYAFRGCKDVTSISIPNTVVSFGAYAMADCSYTEISIPYRVMDIGIHSLDCKTLERIVVSEDNSYYTSIDDVLYNKEKTILYQYPAAKSSVDFSVPEGVRRFVSGSISTLNAQILDLPSTFEWLGDWNLMQAPNLSKIIVRSAVIPWCHNSFNKNICENCILYVPDDMVEDYKNHEDWGSFKNIKPLSEASSVSTPSIYRLKEKGVYGLSGTKRPEMEKGVNIVVKSDGTATKIIK